jgi:phenolic acid decarboxylase
MSNTSTEEVTVEVDASATITPEDIIGKTIEYAYGESIYHVTIDNATEMHWEAMTGDEKGTKEDETYKIEPVGKNLLFITWGEANGIGVSQVLDFNKGIVHNHLLRGRDISIGQGNIRILNK